MIIVCVDVQCQNLFQRLSFELIDVEGFYLNKFGDNSQKGCILNIDLEYLEKLHNLDNDYLSAPKKIR